MDEDFIKFSEFAHRVPGLTIRQAMKLSNAGSFPKYVKWSERSQPVFNRAAVEAWIARRVAESALEEYLDGEPNVGHC